TTGQRDRLSIERRFEIDRVAITRVGQRLAQGASAGIVRIRYGEGARRHAAIAEAGIHPVFLDEEFHPVEDDIVLGAVARDRSRAILIVALSCVFPALVIIPSSSEWVGDQFVEKVRYARSHSIVTRIVVRAD